MSPEEKEKFQALKQALKNTNSNYFIVDKSESALKPLFLLYRRSYPGGSNVKVLSRSSIDTFIVSVKKAANIMVDMKSLPKTDVVSEPKRYWWQDND